MTNPLPTTRRHPHKKAMLLSLALALIISLVAQAQDASGIKNLRGANLDLMSNHDPASQLENFELLPNYQVNLFASDPMFANPVHMHWDSKGRLWVACSWAYPQLKPGEVANDKIIVLEDTDDDGAAISRRFSRTVFIYRRALNWPTADATSRNRQTFSSSRTPMETMLPT